MPEFMKEYREERKNMETPIMINHSKGDFILEWIKLFDDHYASDKENYQPFHDKLKTSDLGDLRKAFKWTHKNFAELDLGGNMKWYGVLMDILFLKKHEDKESIYREFVQDTRWYND